MATAFGVRLLGTALVVISGFYRFPRQRTRVGFLSDHCRRAEVDYQSGSKQPHSKGSADLCTGLRLNRSFCSHFSGVAGVGYENKPGYFEILWRFAIACTVWGD